MTAIKQLTNTTIEEIHQTFAEAFSDYVEPFDLTVQQLSHMIERRGCDLNLSFGAFKEDKLVGFTLNGIGNWQGKLTAYDTGTGIIPEFRKQGIAKKIFAESLPVLKEHNIVQYLLEVIKSNTGAYELYKKSGFCVTREFDYYITPIEKIVIPENNLNTKVRVLELEDAQWNLFTTFWDFEPSWQNSIYSILRKKDYFKFLGLYEGNNLAGYGIIEKHTGDIPQMAISPNHRRKGFGKILLKNLIEYSESGIIKFINPEADYKPFKNFMGSLNIEPGDGQYEMILEL